MTIESTDRDACDACADCSMRAVLPAEIQIAIDEVLPIASAAGRAAIDAAIAYLRAVRTANADASQSARVIPQAERSRLNLALDACRADHSANAIVFSIRDLVLAILSAADARFYVRLGRSESV